MSNTNANNESKDKAAHMTATATAVELFCFHPVGFLIQMLIGAFLLSFGLYLLLPDELKMMESQVATTVVEETMLDADGNSVNTVRATTRTPPEEKP